MAWTTPRTWVAGETVTAALMNTHIRDNLNFLRSGVISSNTVVANVGPTSASTELVLATSASITFDGFTQVEVSFNWLNINLTVATDTFRVKIYDGITPGTGTQIGPSWILISAAVGGSGMTRGIVTPSAGAHQYTARLVRVAGSGTATLSAAALDPAILAVAQVN